jgi:hypothetical protein
MLPPGVVLLHNNVYLPALKHCWIIPIGSCLTILLALPDLTPSGYHLFTYLNNWLFSDNEELMDGVETWPRSQAMDFFDRGIQNPPLRQVHQFWHWLCREVA